MVRALLWKQGRECRGLVGNAVGAGLRLPFLAVALFKWTLGAGGNSLLPWKTSGPLDVYPFLMAFSFWVFILTSGDDAVRPSTDWALHGRLGNKTRLAAQGGNPNVTCVAPFFLDRPAIRLGQPRCWEQTVGWQASPFGGDFLIRAHDPQVKVLRSFFFDHTQQRWAALPAFPGTAEVLWSGPREVAVPQKHAVDLIALADPGHPLRILTR